MKKILVIIGLSLFLFSCKKRGNNICVQCVVTKSVHSATVAFYSKDTVLYCGESDQDISAFKRSNMKQYSTKDSSNMSSIICN